MPDCIKVGTNFLNSAATLIKRVGIEKCDERAAKCGRDIMLGLADGTHCKRYNAWMSWINNKSLDMDCRDGMIVPKIKEKDETE